jgi:hypothetical protein
LSFRNSQLTQAHVEGHAHNHETLTQINYVLRTRDSIRLNPMKLQRDTVVGRHVKGRQSNGELEGTLCLKTLDVWCTTENLSTPRSILTEWCGVHHLQTFNTWPQSADPIRVKGTDPERMKTYQTTSTTRSIDNQVTSSKSLNHDTGNKQNAGKISPKQPTYCKSTL